MGVEAYNKKSLERLKAHKVSFDQEAMWERLQEKKKKRRGVFFFLTMALVALAIVFFALGIESWLDNKSIENSHSLERTEQQNTYQKTSQNLESNSKNNSSEKGLSTAEIHELSLVQNKNGIKNSSQSSSTLDSKISINSEAKNRNKNTALRSANDQNNSLASSENKQKYNSGDIVGVLNKNSNQQQNTEAALTPTIDSGQISEIENARDVNSSDNTSINDQDLSSDQKSGSQTENSIIPDTEADNKIMIAPIEGIELPFLEPIYRSLLKLDIVPKSTPPIVEVKKSKSRWTIGAYAGLGITNRRVDVSLDTSLVDKTLEELSYGIDLKYQLSPFLYLLSGAEYWHVTDQRIDIQKEIFNLQDEEVPSLEGQNGIVIRITRDKRYTIYQSLNIPLIVGFNTNNDRWNVFAEAGVFAGVYQNTRGEFYPSESMLNIGFNVMPTFGGGISYSISDNIELFTRVAWRGRQDVSTIRESEETRSFSAIRSQIGIRIGF